MIRTKADKAVFIFAAALVLLTAFAVFDGFYRQCRAVRENTLRLHIIANSDSEADQKNKLLVRDAVLAEYAEALAAGDSVADAVRVTQQLTGAISMTAQKTLRSAGCEDTVTASVVSMYFDTITYDDGKTMPAGEYEALRIVIGEGAGHNWWCVMYPPLCVPAAEKKTLTPEEERILSLNDTPHVTAKFAVVELYEKLKAACFGK